MAYSYVRYPGDGATVAFSIPFQYISTGHIKVSINSVLQESGYTFPSASSVQLSSPPAGGSIVEIRRVTPKDARLVDFQDGSILNEFSLDLDGNQGFFIAQETLDDAEDALKLSSSDVYDFSAKRASNLADPVDPQDAVTKAFAQANLLLAQIEATNAASSASSAASSASSAASSASSAAVSASNALVSRNNAATSASEASTSAASAATSASTATTKASEASTSASAAATSASNASTSANNAWISESNAFTYAGQAITAKDETLAAYDAFDDRYLGAKTSDPSLDNDGNALIVGALYFNSVAGEMRVWNGSSWLAGYLPSSTYATNAGLRTIWVPAIDINPRTTNGPAVGSVETTLNKVMLKTLDYDLAVAEYAQFTLKMPKGYNGGAVQLVPVWSSTGYGNVVWSGQAVALSDDDPTDAAFSSSVTVTDGVGTVQDYGFAGPISVTPAGGPVAGDLVVFQIARAAANPLDTLDQDARLHGVAVLYTTTTLNDT